jgi:hypothetical protein
MNRFAAWLSVWLASLGALSAQVTVEVVLDQGQFLPNEALPVKVRVTNFSGQTLQLGEREDWLRFSIEAQDGFIVRKQNPVPVAGEFVLESSHAAVKQVDLAPHFGIEKPGRYTVTASIWIQDWKQLISSQPVHFDIMSGAPVREPILVGVPRAEGEEPGAPERRKFTLLQARYLDHLRLYLRVTDATEQRVLRVFPLCNMVSFSDPEVRVDERSNLHVLNQTGPVAFNYTVATPDGDVLVRQTHQYTHTRPRLKLADDGKIAVSGGVRRPASTDVPVAKSPGVRDEVEGP